MLSKKHRLAKKKDFERVFKAGEYCQEEFIGLKIVRNNMKFNRYGFAVGLKVSKKAVVRNKIRRQLSEIIRLKSNKIKTGFDMVILAQPGIISKSYQEINKALTVLFKKLKLFSET